MTTPKTIAEALHRALIAKAAAEERGTYLWSERWQERIDQLLDTAPSGSGFDAGTQVQSWNSHQLKFKTSYHHMQDGFYVGWTDHVITVQPGWRGPEVTRCTGSSRNGLKDYIFEVFYDWLTSDDVPPYPWTEVTARTTEEP